jgi:hypothetical protein
MSLSPSIYSQCAESLHKFNRQTSAGMCRVASAPPQSLGTRSHWCWLCLSRGGTPRPPAWHTLTGKGRRRIYRARGLFLRCFDAPPPPHHARLAAAAPDRGHLGAWRRAEPVAICSFPAACPGPRPRPFRCQPAHPPHRDTALMHTCTHTQRLPFTGGRGRSATGHLHSHITPHANIWRMKLRISNEFVLTL